MATPSYELSCVNCVDSGGCTEWALVKNIAEVGEPLSLQLRMTALQAAKKCVYLATEATLVRSVDGMDDTDAYPMIA